MRPLARGAHTYDPADRIRYVHMTQETEPYAAPVETGQRWTQLPAGYANQSPRTRLRPPRRRADRIA